MDVHKIDDYLADVGLLKFAPDFRRLSFTDTKKLKVFQESDINLFTEKRNEIERREILLAVRKMQSPQTLALMKNINSYPKPRSLHLDFESDTAHEDDIPFVYKDPRTTRLELLQDQVNDLKRELDFAEKRFNEEVEKYRRPSGLRTAGTQCGNCHLYGHKKTKCEDEPCPTARNCGDINHKDHKIEKQKRDLLEKSFLKAKQAYEQKVSEYELKSVQNDKQDFGRLIHEDLVLSNPKKYMFIDSRGNRTYLGAVIKADTEILRKAFKNKMPEDISCHDLQGMIRSFNKDSGREDHLKNSDYRKKGLRRLCEVRGVTFPGGKSSEKPTEKSSGISSVSSASGNSSEHPTEKTYGTHNASFSGGKSSEQTTEKGSEYPSVTFGGEPNDEQEASQFLKDIDTALRNSLSDSYPRPDLNQRSNMTNTDGYQDSGPPPKRNKPGYSVTDTHQQDQGYSSSMQNEKSYGRSPEPGLLSFNHGYQNLGPFTNHNQSGYSVTAHQHEQGYSTSVQVKPDQSYRRSPDSEHLSFNNDQGQTSPRHHFNLKRGQNYSHQQTPHTDPFSNYGNNKPYGQSPNQHSFSTPRNDSTYGQTPIAHTLSLPRNASNVYAQNMYKGYGQSPNRNVPYITRSNESNYAQSANTDLLSLPRNRDNSHGEPVYSGYGQSPKRQPRHMTENNKSYGWPSHQDARYVPQGVQGQRPFPANYPTHRRSPNIGPYGQSPNRNVQYEPNSVNRQPHYTPKRDRTYGRSPYRNRRSPNIGPYGQSPNRNLQYEPNSVNTGPQYTPKRDRTYGLSPYRNLGSMPNSNDIPARSTVTGHFTPGYALPPSVNNSNSGIFRPWASPNAGHTVMHKPKTPNMRKRNITNESSGPPVAPQPKTPTRKRYIAKHFKKRLY